MVRMVVVVFVKAQNVAIVGGAASSVGEEGVGLGEEREVVSGVGIGAICVGMMSFGECVERSNESREKNGLVVSCKL
jgi:hypothetical protein